MTKRVGKTATKKATETATQKPQGTATTSPPEVAESPIYRMGSWKGLPQWQCRFCQWDTVESAEVMLLHYATTHGPQAPARKRVALPLVDARGNPIEREVTDG